VTCDNHAQNCVRMGLEMIEFLASLGNDLPFSLQMRVGVHTGSVIAGVLGRTRYQFDVWSQAVSIANALESTSLPGYVHVSATTLLCLRSKYSYVPRLRRPEETWPSALEGMESYLISHRKTSRASNHAEEEAHNVKEDEVEIIIKQLFREGSNYRASLVCCRMTPSHADLTRFALLFLNLLDAHISSSYIHLHTNIHNIHIYTYSHSPICRLMDAGGSAKRTGGLALRHWWQ
jgi:hypothetical protein